VLLQPSAGKTGALALPRSDRKAGWQGTKGPTKNWPSVPPLLRAIQTPRESKNLFPSSKTRATRFPELLAAEVPKYFS